MEGFAYTAPGRLTRLACFAFWRFWLLLALVPWSALSSAPAREAEVSVPDPFVPLPGKPIDQWLMIGPFAAAKSDDSATSTAALRVASFEDSARIHFDNIIWHEEKPYSWFGASSNASGWLDARACFSGAREGNLIYLHRMFFLGRDAKMVLALGSHGPLMAWIDGQPIAEMAKGIWSPPGDDRWLVVVDLEKGNHHLVLRSEKPAAALPWSVRVRFLNTESFARGSVAYPRWQVSSAPPWDKAEGGDWARWGDTAIQEFLNLAPTSGTVEVMRYADPLPATRYKIGVGKPFPLAPFASPGKASLFSFRAEMPNLQQGMLEGKLSLVKAATLLSFIFGNPAELPLLEPGSTTPSSRSGRSSRVPHAADSRIIDNALKDPAIRLDDAEGIRFAILRRTAEYLRRGNPTGKGSLCPTGWFHLGYGGATGTAGLSPYTVQMPPGMRVGDEAKLILAMVPLETDPFHLPLRETSLASVAERQGWVLAGLQVDRPYRGMKSDEMALDSVKKDLERRFGLRFTSLNLIGLRDAAPLALVQALLHSNLYSGAALLEGAWASVGSWDDLFQNHCPRPALYFAGPSLESFYPLDSLGEALLPEDGVWARRALTSANRYQIMHDMVTFFAEKSGGEPAGKVAVSALSRLQGQPSWLAVRQSIDLAQPASLTGQVVSTNTLSIEPSNVAQFDVLLTEVPMPVIGAPLLMRIGDQNVRIIARNLPEALRLSLVEDPERGEHWEATPIRQEAVVQRTQSETVVATANSDLPAYPDGKSGGIAGLYARAIRELSGASISIIPAQAIESGQPKGRITRSDIAGWSRDAVLATATLSAHALLSLLERDYAGPRRYVTDGFRGIVRESASSIPAGTDVQGGPSIAQHREADETAVSSQTSVSIQGGIFLSSALDDLASTLVVVSWKPVLESLRRETAPPERAGYRSGPTTGGAEGLPTQIEAAIRFLSGEKQVPPINPDIIRMERKGPPEDLKKTLRTP